MSQDTFNVYRGGKQAGSLGLLTCGRSTNPICSKCGQLFPNSRKLRSHLRFTYCQQSVDFPVLQRENGSVKEFSCVECGESFTSQLSLEYHRHMCGKFENMQQVVIENVEYLKRNETEKENGVGKTCDTIVIDEDSEPEVNNFIKKEAEYVKLLDNLECKMSDEKLKPNFMSSREAVEQNIDSYTRRKTEDKIKDDTNTARISESVKNAIKKETKLLKDSETKRKYDVMDSTTVNDLRKRLKIEDAPLYKSLQDDIQQEKRHNLFDRVSDDRRFYKCPKCFVRFKYKHKFDIHIKFAHVRTEMFISDKNLEDFRQVPDKNSDFTRYRNQISKPGLEIQREETKPTINESGDKTIKTANYPCDFCDMSFRHQSRYQRHLKSAHEEQMGNSKFGNIFRCSECNERMPDKYELLNHYKGKHIGRKMSTEEELGANEHIKNILDVNDIMKHLRRNLLCLQDDKSTYKDNSYKNVDFTLKMEDEPSNTSVHGSVEKSSQKPDNIRESRDVNLILVDESEHKREIATHRNTSRARKMKFKAEHYYPLMFKDSDTRNFDERTQIYKEKMAYPQSSSDVHENNEPVDLSINAAKKYSCPDDVSMNTGNEKMPVVDGKPSEYERSLLLEYYKDFLQEYGLK